MQVTGPSPHQIATGVSEPQSSVTQPTQPVNITSTQNVETALLSGCEVPVAYTKVLDSFSKTDRMHIEQGGIAQVDAQTLLSTVAFSGCGYFLFTLGDRTFCCHSDKIGKFEENTEYPKIARMVKSLVQEYTAQHPVQYKNLLSKIMHLETDKQQVAVLLEKNPSEVTDIDMLRFVIFKVIGCDSNGPIATNPTTQSITFPKPYMMKSWSRGCTHGGILEARPPDSRHSTATESIAFMVREGEQWHCLAGTYFKPVRGAGNVGGGPSSGIILNIARQEITPFALMDALQQYVDEKEGLQYHKV